MKKLFEEAMMDAFEFLTEDIITTSPGDDFSNTGDPFEGEDDVFGPGDYTF